MNDGQAYLFLPSLPDELLQTLSASSCSPGGAPGWIPCQVFLSPVRVFPSLFPTNYITFSPLTREHSLAKWQKGLKLMR